MRRVLLILIVLSAPAVPACDREPAAAPSPTAPPAPATTAAPAPVSSVRLWPIAALLPGRVTHVAVDASGHAFWVQESDAGDDVVFAAGETGVPRATRVSAATLLAGAADAAPSTPADATTRSTRRGRVGGNVQSLAAGADGGIYFYFTGGVGPRTVACLGRFDPRTNTVRVLADAGQLADASGMGASLAVARGTLVAQGPWIWLWLRHTDAAVLLRVDLRDLPAGSGTGPERAASTQPSLRFEQPIRGAVRDETGAVVDLRDDALRLAAGGGGSLLLLDPPGSVLRSIDPETAMATTVRALAGLPRALTAPAVDPRSGHVMLFAAGGEPLPPRTEAQLEVDVPPVTYPALLVLDGPRLTVVGRDAIRGHAGLQVHNLRLQQLVADPRADGGWVGYDSASGELLRVTVR